MGDVLRSVNGVRTSDMDDYLQARSLRDDVVALVVIRDEAEVSVDIDLDRMPLSGVRRRAMRARPCLHRVVAAPIDSMGTRY